MSNEEELYIFVLYNLMDKLKDKVKFRTSQIDYDNLELVVEESNLENIGTNDFSISFQKQNGSFTLITNETLDQTKRQKVVGLLSQTTQIDLFASYKFSDMQDINIDHFVYDDNKLDFNTNILRGFEKENQLTGLSIKRRVSPNNK